MTSRRASFIAVAMLTASGTARADEAAPQGSADRVRAQELFESALADAEAGRHAEACPKFAASYEADPKTSTLLNLGSCYESIDRTASAWAAFREAEGLARTAGRPDLAKLARARADVLAPKLVRLTITVPPSSRTPGLVVSRDGVKMTSAEWGLGIPVDPGAHEITAQAPSHLPWRATVIVRGADSSVEVPALAAAPARAAPPQQAAAPGRRSWWTPLRTTGVALAGAGAASALTGFVLAFLAKSNYDDAFGSCRAVDDCPRDAVTRGDDARALATGATIAIVAGAALAAIGGGIVVVAPSPGGREATVGMVTRW